MNKKSILIVLTQAPQYSSANQEALDLALAAASFEQDVCLVYEGDAVYQLAQSQDPALVGRKNLPKVMRALPIYGVEKQYLYRPAQLQHLSLEGDLPVLDSEEYQQLVASSDTVLRF